MTDPAREPVPSRIARIRTRVDWHERHRLLKLAFPVAVHAQDAAYETQFGHVRRPLHTNTSWDEARYEVCAHRWVHVGEPGTGAAIVNDGMYGHDATRTTDADGTVTTVRQSLLRAPRFPDPDADQGVHEFTSVFAPAETTATGSRASVVRSLETSIASPRCTPPTPPVANNLMPLRAAAHTVAETVVAPSPPRAQTKGRSATPHFLKRAPSRARASSVASSTPTRT